MRTIIVLSAVCLLAVACHAPPKGHSGVVTRTLFGAYIEPPSEAGPGRLAIGVQREQWVVSPTNETRGVVSMTEVERKGWNRNKLRTWTIIGNPILPPEGANFFDAFEGNGNPSLTP